MILHEKSMIDWVTQDIGLPKNYNIFLVSDVDQSVDEGGQEWVDLGLLLQLQEYE